MSGYKLEVDRAAGAGSVFVETDDIEDISPVKDGQHAAAVTVRWRSEYADSGAFVWIGEKRLRLLLLPRQVRSAVDHLREVRTGFCSGENNAGCYDFAKVARPPSSCTLCLLSAACLQSGQGELRRAVPEIREGPGIGLPACLVLVVLLWWWTLCQWSAAATDASNARDELRGCRAQQSPTARR